MLLHRSLSLLAGGMILASSMVAQPAERLRHRIDEELKLTDSQKEQVDKLRSAHMKTMIAQRAKVAAMRVDIHDLLKADNVDRSAVEKKLQEVAGLEVNTHLQRLDHWTAVNKILTPEQQKAWKEMRSSWGDRGHMRGMRGRGMGKGMHGGEMHDGQRMNRMERMHR